MTERANDAMSSAREMTQGLGEKASQAMSSVREATQGLSEKARTSARDAGAAADLYLHEYAWTTMAIVAVTAVTLGFLLGRRNY